MSRPRTRPAVRPRRYRSALRQQLKDDVRARIVRAVVDLVVDEGAHAFTMQNVAEKAQVALRTVYRHFASRDQLLEALSDHVDAAMNALGMRMPTEEHELPETMRRAYVEYFAKIRKELRASVVASIGTGYRSRSHVARWTWVREFLEKTYPHIPPGELGDMAAMLTVVTGSRAWFVLTAEFGLDDARAASAAEWGVRALVESLKRRNTRARKARN
jgi:AcrR family transcriptional regulator